VQRSYGLGLSLAKPPTMTKTTLVYFRYGDLERPVIKVEERADGDVTIMIRSERNEHLSLHTSADGVLLTHYAPELASSTHDEARVAAARAAGYRDPERHKHYIAHWTLNKHVIDMDGHELVGRRITLVGASAKPKYENMPRIVIDVPAAECTVTLILATAEQPYSKPEEPHVETSVGDLYFRPERR